MTIVFMNGGSCAALVATLLQAVCQMVMNGDTKFEEALLKLDSAEQDPTDKDGAIMALEMFCLDCTGFRPLFDVPQLSCITHVSLMYP